MILNWLRNYVMGIRRTTDGVEVDYLLVRPYTYYLWIVAATSGGPFGRTIHAGVFLYDRMALRLL